MNKTIADTPEMKILANIFEGKKYSNIDMLLHIRNKVCDSDMFSDDESLELSNLIIDLAEEDGYITWDEDKQEYVRNSDGLPIAKI